MSVNRLHQRVGVAGIDSLQVSRAGAVLHTCPSVPIDELIVPRAGGTRQVGILSSIIWPCSAFLLKSDCVAAPNCVLAGGVLEWAGGGGSGQWIWPALYGVMR